MDLLNKEVSITVHRNNNDIHIRKKIHGVIEECDLNYIKVMTETPFNGEIYLTRERCYMIGAYYLNLYHLNNESKKLCWIKKKDMETARNPEDAKYFGINVFQFKNEWFNYAEECIKAKCGDKCGLPLLDLKEANALMIDYVIKENFKLVPIRFKFNGVHQVIFNLTTKEIF